MSRSVSATIESAIVDSTASRIYVKAEIEKSFSMFSTLTNDNAFEGSPYGTIQETPRPQCMGYSAYHDKAVTFIVDDSGNIIGMVQGSGTQFDTGLNTSVDCKPAYVHISAGNGKLWYWNPSDSKVYRTDIDTSDFTTGSSSSWSVTPSGWTVSKGSLHSISSTEVVFTYVTSKGGIAVAHFDGSTWTYWSRRFLSANKVVDSGYWTVYCAAVRHDNKIFIFSTDMDTGEVRGVYYDDTWNKWSDTYIALPADLSRFCVCNAISENGYIHLAGQFHKTDDLVAGKIYSLVLRSTDGKNFSWDRFTLLSSLGYHFQIALHPTADTLYASDRNRVGTSTLSYFYRSPTATMVSLDPPTAMLTYNADSINSATLVLAAANEALIDNTVVAKNNRVKVYAGYNTTAGDEYVLYGTYIIASKDILYADGQRGLNLQLISEGIWKTQQIAFPFYSEITTRVTQRDDCDQRDLLYTAPSGTESLSGLVCDFWRAEKFTASGVTGYSLQSDTGDSPSFFYSQDTSTLGFKTQPLAAYLGISGDITINSATVTAKIYGWMRTSVTSRPNDTIELRLICQDENGSETIHTGTLTSTYSKFDRQSPSVASGSYPVKWDFTGMTVGHKLIAVAVVVSNNVIGESTGWFERIEVTNLQFSPPGLHNNLSWKQTKPSTYADADPTILELPAMGLPYIMFLTKPYTAYNFNVHAQFEHEAGDYPIAIGEGGWGVVGMAADGYNYILARMNLVNGRIELCKGRGGKKTVLANYTPVDNKKRLMMEHRDGEIKVWYADAGYPHTWVDPVITYNWDEVTHGAISTSATQIMHVGIYAEKNTPKFRIPGYCILDAYGIPCIASSDTTVMDQFPSPGYVNIDNIRYYYGTKYIADEQWGPYSCRQVSDYDGQLAAEITMFYPNGQDVYLDYMASDYGHCMIITGSIWNVYHSNQGTSVYLPNRSRHYLYGLRDDQYMGTGNRMYITSALVSVRRETSGTAVVHSYGTWCFLDATDQIWVKEVVGTTLDKDTTVQDMIRVLCSAASTKCNFPGNYVEASGSAVASPDPIGDETFMPDGIDITFTTEALSTYDDYIAVCPTGYYINGNTNAVKIGLKNLAGSLYAYAQEDGVATSDGYYIKTSFSTSDLHKIRVLLYKEYCSIYVDDISVAIFAFEETTWPNTAITIKMYGNTTAYTNLDMAELFDWRGSIYIESEMSAANAISSVIQERPIDIIPKSDGSLDFTYDLRRDTITYTSAISNRIIRKHNKAERISPDAGSDAVVYYADVTFAHNDSFAGVDGFQTRVLKLSGLDTGAKNAANILLEKANERQYPHTLLMRPDIRVEPGDIISVTYTLSGTGTIITEELVVEDIRMSIEDGRYDMAISGRKNL